MTYTQKEQLEVTDTVRKLIENPSYWVFYGITPQSTVIDLYRVALNIHFKTDQPDAETYLRETLR